MKIVSLVSMKGGVGKTSIAAGLATSLVKRLGKGRVCVVDLDPKNMLCWHLGLGNMSSVQALRSEGASFLSTESSDVRALLSQSESGVLCLPYGQASELQRKSFEAALSAQPSWLSDLLQRAKVSHDALVIVDTPPGPSVYQRQALNAADLALALSLPDAASFATIASMETSFANHLPGHKLRSYVINQYDQRQPLGVDVVNLLRQQLTGLLSPVLVCQDEGMREALALQQTCLQYDPHCRASHDIDQLAQWLLKTLTGGRG